MRGTNEPGNGGTPTRPVLVFSRRGAAKRRSGAKDLEDTWRRKWTSCYWSECGDEALFIPPAPEPAGVGPGPQQGGAKEIVVSVSAQAMWAYQSGAVMSHGYVNLPMDVAALIYNWAPIGTPVSIVG